MKALALDPSVASILERLLRGERFRPHDMPVLKDWLERVLARRNYLYAHIRWLQDAGRKERLPALSVADPVDEVLDRLCAAGVEGLGDEEVVGVLLHPPFLFGIRERIEEEMPQAWLEAMTRVGKKICEEQGIELPSLGLDALPPRGDAAQD